MAARVVPDLDEFPARNVRHEHAALLARAGVHTGRWDRIKEIAPTYNEIHGDGSARLMESAKKAADLFNRPGTVSERSESENAERWAAYEKKGVPSTYSRTEESRRRHRFKMALRYDRQEIAFALMQSHPDVCEFEEALRIFDLYEDPDEAWKSIITRLESWHPVFWCQVAPLELLTAVGVRDLMTPKRCLQVLSTPRARPWWEISR